MGFITTKNINYLLNRGLIEEESKSEARINSVRVYIYIGLLFLAIIIWNFIPDFNKTTMGWIIVVLAAVIPFPLITKFYLKNQSYMLWLKYVFTFLDFSIIAIAVLIVSNTAKRDLFILSIDSAPFYATFIINSINGLRFNIRHSIYCAILSISILIGFYGYDLFNGLTLTTFFIVKGFFIAIFLAGTALVSGYIGQQAKKIIIQKYFELEEKNLSHQIQQNLIPRKNPSYEGVTFSSIYHPMKEVGGDFYDYIPFPEDKKIGIFISDVSGHGVPAALITSMIKTLIKTSDENRYYSDRFLNYLNNKIIGLTSGNFLTAIYAIYDIENRILKYTRGGHPYPIVIRDEKTIIPIKSPGTFIGIFNDMKFTEKEYPLEKGDKVLFYTDGLTEARNSNDEEFNNTLMNVTIPYNAHRSIDDLIKTIFRELILFKGDDNFDDDICIVGMEIT